MSAKSCKNGPVLLAVIVMVALSVSGALAQRVPVGPPPNLRFQNKADAIQHFMTALIKQGEGGLVSQMNANFSQNLRTAMSVLGDTLMDDVGCNPVPQPVSVPQQDGATSFPLCVLLERCSDCCHSPLQACAPKANSTEMRRVQVLRFFSTNNVEILARQDVVEMEVHKACECKCRITQEHCNPRIHIYDPDNCQCTCKDAAASRLCGNNKKWNPNTCSCECLLRPEVCPAGTLYNTTSCLCVQPQVCNRLLPMETTTTTTTAANVCANFGCPGTAYRPILQAATGKCICAFIGKK